MFRDDISHRSRYPFWKDWQEGRLISIINDSLAILATHKQQIGCGKDLFLLS